jgi:hypothetical protein
MLPDVELLQQADQLLSDCGRPLMPPGTRYVPIPKSFLFQATHAFQTTETEAREIYGDTVWMLRAISGLPPNFQIYYRIQYPNGRYLQNQLETLSSFGSLICTLGNGSARRLISPAIPCPPGSRFLITLDDTFPKCGNANGTNVTLLFEGCYIYAIKGNGPQARSEAVEMAEMDRYFQTPNQNIMAPEVALMLKSSATPDGYVDEIFSYQLPLLNLPQVTGIATSNSVTQAFNLPAEWEHHILRFLFTETQTNGTATFGVRIRESKGYSFTNDYIQTYLFNQARYLCDWRIAKGSQLYFDFTLLDPSSAMATFTEQVVIEGIRRRKL